MRCGVEVNDLTSIIRFIVTLKVRSSRGERHATDANKESLWKYQIYTHGRGLLFVLEEPVSQSP
jgi:hypothetical protein